ncbi:putative Histone acetyltransferase KAT8 [Blattamonas nauphoetae]|uniref:Histone acetyltransferase KAT8 n=1 Tax=Blattamonas nauphoetae TaxID=2049346 RepID=A0ABQ9Y4A3_9EUKA|nr:putative Histone acetyltransferase KAT8 [Blattamonas nauphoetae]
MYSSTPIPWVIGETVMAVWRDGQHHPATILEIRQLPNGKQELYIHYTEFERRLDQWIPPEYLLPIDDDEIRTRNRTKKYEGDAQLKTLEMCDPSIADWEKKHIESTKIKYIERLQLGRYEMECWYYSPYPDEYEFVPKLYVCEYCLKYMRKHKTLARHKDKCQHNSPPGRIIYKDGNLVIFEVDGSQDCLYCQNLCLLGKLFLDHKAVFYDVSSFCFYVLCEEEENARVVEAEVVDETEVKMGETVEEGNEAMKEVVKAEDAPTIKEEASLDQTPLVIDQSTDLPTDSQTPVIPPTEKLSSSALQLPPPLQTSLTPTPPPNSHSPLQSSTSQPIPSSPSGNPASLPSAHTPPTTSPNPSITPAASPSKAHSGSSKLSHSPLSQPTVESFPHNPTSNYHIIGFFSKEKDCIEGYNLSCIAVLPPYQRKGYSHFLISISYLLSIREGKLGSPERPLSDLGHRSYVSYWTGAVLDTICEMLEEQATCDSGKAKSVDRRVEQIQPSSRMGVARFLLPPPAGTHSTVLTQTPDDTDAFTITPKQISLRTSIQLNEVMAVLMFLDFLPASKPSCPIIINQDVLDQHRKSRMVMARKGRKFAQAQNLRWVPPSTKDSSHKQNRTTKIDSKGHTKEVVDVEVELKKEKRVPEIDITASKVKRNPETHNQTQLSPKNVPTPNQGILQTQPIIQFLPISVGDT